MQMCGSNQVPVGSRRPSARRLPFVLPAGALLLAACTAQAPALDFFKRFKITPTYETSYKVTRQTETWWQKARLLRRPAGGAVSDLGLDAFVETKIKEDETRNNLRETDDKISLSIRRGSSLGEWSLDLQTRRQRRETNASLNGIGNDYIYLGHGLELRHGQVFSMSVETQVGPTGDLRLNKRVSAHRVTYDSTSSWGWGGAVVLHPEVVLGRRGRQEDFSSRATLTFEGSVLDAGTDHVVEEGDEEEVVRYSETDRNRSFSLISSTSWSRYERCQMQLDVTYQDEMAQFYLAKEQAQETRWVLRKSASLAAGGPLVGTLTYQSKLYMDETSLDSKVQAQDKMDRKRGVSLTVGWDIPRTLLAGTHIEGVWGSERNRVELEATANYTKESDGVGVRVRRDLGASTTLSFRADVDLVQDFYDDGKQDKDRLRQTTSLTLRHDVDHDTPIAKSGSWISLTYATSEDKTIHIAAAKAIQSKIRDDYRLTLYYALTFSEKLAVKQKFMINASYTYYIYNEEENSLRRTNSVQTTIEADPWENLSLEISHSYKRSDSGAYLYSEDLSEKVYGKSNIDLRNTLKAKVQYELVPGLKINAEQRSQVRSTKRADDPVPKRIDKYELFVGGSLSQRLGKGLSVNLSVQRVLSTKDPDYWKVDGSFKTTL